MSRFAPATGLLVIALVTIGLLNLSAAEPPISPAEQKIRAALKGDYKETGNGALDDVLGVIRQNGSILDGSSLDPTASSAATETGTTTKAGGTPSKAYAAEQLLRASRLLENVGPADKDRVGLVHKMRAEAVKLLSE